MIKLIFFCQLLGKFYDLIIILKYNNEKKLLLITCMMYDVYDIHYKLKSYGRLI